VVPKKDANVSKYVPSLNVLFPPTKGCNVDIDIVMTKEMPPLINFAKRTLQDE
jgi:hypothetical protein